MYKLDKPESLQSFAQWLYKAIRRATLPELFVYVMILVTPLMAYRFDFGVSLTLQRLFLLLVLGSWGIKRVVNRDFSWPSSPRSVMFVLLASALLVVYEVAQLPRTEQAGFSYSFVAKIVGGLVIVSAITFILDNREKLKLALIAFLSSSILPLCLGIVQSLGTTLGYARPFPLENFLALPNENLGLISAEIDGERVSRISSTIIDPAFYGEYLVFIAVFLVVLLIYKRLTVPATFAVGGLLSLVGFSLLSTISRSAWLLMVVGLFAIVFHTRHEIRAFLRYRVSRWVLPGVVAGVLLLVLATSFPLVPVFNDSAASIPGIPTIPWSASEAPGSPGETPETSGSPSEGGPDNSGNSLAKSTSSHLNLRTDAVKMFASSPVFGIGLGNLGPEIGQGEGVSSAQAYGFTFLAEGGLVGIGVLVLFMGSFIFAVRSAYLRQRQNLAWKPYLLGLYICLCLLALNNLFLYDTLLRDTSWVLLGLGLAAVANFARDRDSTI